MLLPSAGFTSGKTIPEESTFASMDPEDNVVLYVNRSPALSWSGVPEGTRSFIITLYALDIARCPVEGVANGHAVRKAMKGHFLEIASLMGT